MIRVTATQFDEAVQAALAAIPAQFREFLENVVIEVRARPDRAFQREHDVPGDLLGLYVGTPLEDQADGLEPVLPSRIYLFSENHSQMCESLEELVEEIRVTVLHEVGHHFGMDEDDLERLGYD